MKRVQAGFEFTMSGHKFQTKEAWKSPFPRIYTLTNGLSSKQSNTYNRWT